MALRARNLLIACIVMVAAINFSPLMMHVSGQVYAQEKTENNTAITAETDNASDEAVRLRLREIFQELEGLKGVFVQVNSGIVTLRGTVAEPDLAEEAVGLASRIDSVVTVRNNITIVTSISQRLVPVMERLERRAVTTIAYLPLLGVAFLVFGAITLAGLWVAKRDWPWQRISPNAFIADLLRQIVRIVFALIGIMLALDIMGATSLIGTVLGAAGIVGLAIGFAVRDTVENYIASILLSVRQPFAPNDFVEIEGQQGFVLRLTSRATVLLSLEGNHIRIPNATVFKSIIVNFTRNPQRRFDFTLGINPDGDPMAAIQIVNKALADLDYLITDPVPTGWIENVGDSNILLTFAAWIDQRNTDFAAARSEAIRTAIGIIEGGGFTLPEPTQRILLMQGGNMVTSEPRPEVRRKKIKTIVNKNQSPQLNVTNDTAIEKMIEEAQKDDAENLLDDQTQSEI